MKNKTLFIVAICALLLVFVVGALVYTAKPDEQAGRLPPGQLAALTRIHSPATGRITAPVVVVEFFDPACDTCAAFYPQVKQIMAANPERIRLVLRYAPFHEGSDQIVALLEAARKQNKFWPVLETLLATQGEWAPNHVARIDLAWKPLAPIGLNMEMLRADMAAPEIAAIIGQDLADARTLNVTQTPEYFVNGRPLPSFGFEQLKTLIDDALKATAKL
jgi:protein-disulfide isomerase